jgi:hypothetical protein
VAFDKTPGSFPFPQRFATAPYLETVEHSLHNKNVLFMIHFDINLPSDPMNFRPNIIQTVIFIYYYFTCHVSLFSVTLIHCYIINSWNKTKPSLQYSIRVLLGEVIQCPIWVINVQLWKTGSYSFVLSHGFILGDLTLEVQNQNGSKHFTNVLWPSLPQIVAGFTTLFNTKTGTQRLKNTALYW